MEIKKSGLVSNNYRNYFNILKQKDGEIYLFEMLTVRLNFHSGACVSVCVFAWQIKAEEFVGQVCFLLDLIFLFGPTFWKSSKHLPGSYRGAGRDPGPPTLKWTPANKRPVC